MCSRLSASAPIPPRMPKMNCVKSGGVDEAAVQEVREGVEMADVVALELEPGSVFAEADRGSARCRRTCCGR